MRVQLYLFMSILFFSQCMSKKEPFEEFKVKDKIELIEIPYPELLGETMQLVKVNNFLLVNDFFGDSLIHVFNLSTKQIERKLTGKGVGPSETITPLEIQPVDDYLYILSRPTYSLYHLKLTDLTSDNILLYKDMQLPSLSDCFVALGNSNFVFSGFWEKRYAFLNLDKDENIRPFGEYPDFWEDEKDFSIEIKAFFHQCKLKKHPTKNLFVSCSGYILEIYEFDPIGNQLPVLLFKKQLGKYRYDYIRRDELISTQRRNDSDLKAITIACSEDFIYTVFSPVKNEETCKIVVFDWNIQPIKLIESPKIISCLAIDEKAKKGYCIAKDPEDKLCSFDLE